MKKIIILSVSVIIFLIVISPLYASSVFFSPNIISFQENKNFNVNISIDPQNIKNYTVKLELKYPADLIEVKSFTIGNNWMPLIQSGYDAIDNMNGVLIKTGGYPGGLSKSALFGTILFHAKKSGNGMIQIGDNSASLDANNQNVLTGTPQIGVNIFSITKNVEQTTEEEQVRPDQAQVNIDISGDEFFPETSETSEKPITKKIDEEIATTTTQSFNPKPSQNSLLAFAEKIFNTKIIIPIYAIIFIVIVLFIVINIRKKQKHNKEQRT